ncbi:ankyrin repeat domain-containing protein 45 [Solea solea]|uniref:ankyrin repeat domain-containing protein 45 n=1 Tax=Solea solea TaxID=90069 RepID=UPI00272C817D|nr:ankyrin repeat domain-containing protein 45 [Solea solea]
MTTPNSDSEHKMTSLQEDVFNRVLSADLWGLSKCFESKFEPQENNAFDKKDELGRNALLTASMLGRSAIVRELVRHGAQVNEQTVRGYSSLHLATCWGHLDTVRTLLELNADTESRTFRGERPLDLARRHSRTDCIDCLILADAKQDFESYVSFIKDTISVSEKKLSKEDKNTCMRVCSIKSEWIQSIKSPTVSDFTAQREDMKETLQPILNKLSAALP